LFFVVAGAPFPFGSTNPLSIAFWCGALALCLLFASPRNLKPPHLALLGGILFLILAFAFVLHEQLSEMPWLAKPHPIWAKASEALGVELKGTASVVRDEPLYALGAPLSFILALACGLILGVEREWAHLLMRVIGWSGFAYAIYGIFSLLFEPNMLLWREKTAYVSSLTGTFINRNSAAAYFGSCAVIWLILLLQRVREHLPRSPIEWRKVPEHLIGDVPSDVLLRFGVFFVCLVAMFMTNSRAGVTISLAGMIVAFVLFFRRDLPRGRGLIIPIVAATVVSLILLEVLGGNIGQRFDAHGAVDNSRLAAWRSTLQIIADHPWFGTGLGTFPYVFPLYRSSEVSMFGIWDAAHDTPLEFAAELGLPLTVLVGLAWLIAFGVLLRAVFHFRRRVLVPLAALVVAFIAMSHSIVDFSLQIPGYAIVVFALIGTGLAQAFQDEALDRNGNNVGGEINGGGQSASLR
jgi:O-antigen ligase